MGDMTANFDLSEFACNCGCGFDAIKTPLVFRIQDIRTIAKRPVKIISGCRCAAHNKTVGGKEPSQHVFGTAADIHISGLTVLETYALVSVVRGFIGIGIYPQDGFVHVDVRTGPVATWSKWDGEYHSLADGIQKCIDMAVADRAAAGTV
jgi:uncharacterized protein YcbK (DUF882 family)